MMLSKSHSTSRIKLSSDKVVFYSIGYPLIAIFAIFCLLPFWLVVSGSFTSQHEIIVKGFSLWPKEFTLDGYRLSLANPGAVGQAYIINIIVTVSGTLSSVFICTMTGYVLTRKDFPWRFGFSLFFFFTTLFSGGLIPFYLLVVNTLGLKDNILSLILPGIVSVWNILLVKGFMSSVPFEMTESAKIDGAGDFRIFLQLIIPVSTPVIATISLFTALGFWNDWFRAMLFIDSPNLRPLQYFLHQLIVSTQAMRAIMDEAGIVSQTLPVESMRMSMTVIVTGPIILLYPLLQRYFIKGLTVGSVKG
ncbi:MAG: carbohydrate ABC transporter permease [Christensenellales bacterium]|jgi:putative aldouronate transport system permease protein